MCSWDALADAFAASIADAFVSPVSIAFVDAFSGRSCSLDCRRSAIKIKIKCDSGLTCIFRYFLQMQICLQDMFARHYLQDALAALVADACVPLVSHAFAGAFAGAFADMFVRQHL